jgi:hypothetical protein
MKIVMNDQRTFKIFFHKLGGYYLIPHELLHVLAYRLIGKPCEYKWGDYRVRSLARKTRPEKLFVLLFPFVACWGLGFFFGFLWVLSAFFIEMPPERYFIDGPTWHFVFPVLAFMFILYSGNGYGDVINAYRLLLTKDKARH